MLRSLRFRVCFPGSIRHGFGYRLTDLSYILVPDVFRDRKASNITYRLFIIERPDETRTEGFLNTYYLTLYLLLAVAAFSILNQIRSRFLYFLQMFQQHGYKTDEFSGWILQRFYSRVITAEHGLFIVVVFSLMIWMSGWLTSTAITLVLSIYAIFWFGGRSRFQAGRQKKPLVFTARMKRLASFQGAFLIVFIYMVADLSLTGRLLNTPLVIRDQGASLLQVDSEFLLFGLVLVDMSVPLFLFLAGWALKPVERWIQSRFKRQARNRLESMPDLKVVAITGSYGKTSTKFMIRDLLRERFRVCATPGSFNTPMGICKVINNDLAATDQVLVLEMGARRRGDIRELCRIARPDLAVITNVGTAHLETFGSKEAIAREKSVLAQEVNPAGTLVLNGDDETVLAMEEVSPAKTVVIAGTTRGVITAEEISYDETGTRFTLVLDEPDGIRTRQPIGMKLLGRHNVQNFLLAAAVARSFGLRPETIALAAQEIQPVEHRLELKQWNGVTVIDDAFNSNPEGARQAVEILSSFQTGRRILITPGMVELGEIQEEENRKFGHHIAAAGLDLVLLVGPRQTTPILLGIREQGSDENVRVVSSLYEANELLKEWIRDGDVVLYENDLPDTYREE